MTFDNSGKPSRGLPFPLKNPETFSFVPAEGDILHLTPDVFPPDSDERINIVLNLSLNEFVAIASSLDVGSDIAYGDNRNLIWFTWVRSFIGLAASMSCEDIADCIETSDAVAIQLAINNAKNNLTIGGRTTTVNPATTTVEDDGGIGASGLAEEIKTIENCNQDKLWAGIRDGIVQRLDDNARNFLEVLVARADLAERAQELINLVPVLGTMLVAVIEQVTELAPDMLNLYNSYSSLEHLDEIACDLFDMVCADCQYPTYDQLFSRYASAGISGMDDIGNLVLTAATDYLTGSTELAALAFYHTMISYQLFILYMKTKFGSAHGTQSILEWASLGEDYANDNWQLLCDGCNEPYEVWEWDFVTQGQGEWYVDAAIGSVTNKPVFINGKGWLLVNHSTGRRADIAMLADPAWEFRSAAYNVSGAAVNTRQFHMRPTQGSTSGQITSGTAGGYPPPYNCCFNGFASITNKQEVGIFVQQTGQTEQCYIERVAILFNKTHSKSPAIPHNGITICE